MKFKLINIIGFLLISNSFGEDVTKTTDQLLKEANAFLSSGKFNEAMESYSAAIEKDPNNYLTYFKRATAYVTLGKSQQAIEDFTQLLSIKPDFAQALFHRGKIHVKRGDFDLALKDLSGFISSNPDHVEANEMLSQVKDASEALELAEKQLNDKQYNDASETLSTLLQVSPQNINLRKKRAFSAISQNLYDEAIGDWTRVAQLSPLDQEVLSKLALANYYSLYDSSAALKNVKQILHYDPDNKRFKSIFRQIKKTEKDIANLEKLYKKKSWKAIINILNGEEGKQGLIKSIDDAINSMMEDIGSTSPGPNKLKGQIYVKACVANQRLKNKNEAADMCSKAIEFDPSSIAALVARSEIHIINEKFQEAIDDLNKALEINKNDNKIREKLKKAHQLLKTSKQKDYYKILGVSRSADQKEIKRAFLKQARKWHPDTYRGDLPKDEVEKKMAELNTAYEVLSDENLKARYDSGDDPNDPTGGQGPHAHPFHGGNPFGNGDPFQFFFQNQKGGGGFHQQHFEFHF